MNEKFRDKQVSQKEDSLSYEYVRGLVEGEGSFCFHTSSVKPDGSRYKLPAFYISMHIRDKELLKKVRDAMGLKNRIYAHPSNGLSKCRMATLAVRDFNQLKDIIIPFFYKKLKGYKAQQFTDWLEKIGSDPEISDRFKSLYRLYKWGIYDNDPKFTEKFKN